MKTTMLYFTVMVTVLAFECRDMGQPFDDDVVNQVGTIVQEDGQSYLIKSDTPVPTKWGNFDIFFR